MLVPPPGPRAGGFDFDAPTGGGEDARVVPPPAGEEDVGALEGADCRVGPEGGVGKGRVEDCACRLVYAQSWEEWRRVGETNGCYRSRRREWLLFDLQLQTYQLLVSKKFTYLRSLRGKVCSATLHLFSAVVVCG